MKQKKQNTIKKEVSCSGVGVHSGKEVKITIKPAPENYGIKFSRIDVSNKILIPAFFKMVVDTSLATVIGSEGAIVSTIEHLMAAFSGLEIDNALVELNSYEMPILDGSAKVYVEMLEEAGINSQEQNKFFFIIKKKVKIKEGDSELIIEPFNKFKISCTIKYSHPLIKKQSISMEINKENFIKEIASARTFGFVKDLELYKRSGLAKGASLSTGIALLDSGVMNKEGLRFKDEFVRHKLLDCVGDFSLLGMPILGHIRAFKTGHSFNHKLLKTLLEKKDTWETRELI